MTGEPPADPEPGLPGKHGEFAISVPWITRFALTAAIGAGVGFAASTVLSPRASQMGWAIIAAGAIATTFLSIRKVHGWQISTFADGTIVGLAAGPLFMLLTLLSHFTFGAVWQGLLTILFAFTVVLIAVPCGWVAGFLYHLVLSATERIRAGDDDSA